MSKEQRIKDLLNLGIEYAFCPPSDEQYPTGRIYLKKAILDNPNESEALELLSQCEQKAQIIVNERQLLEEQNANRKEEIRQIKEAIQLIQDSDKPAWEKKLLIRLAKELRE